MLFTTTCVHCRKTMEISRAKLDQLIRCSQCDRDFVARDGNAADVPFEFAADEPDIPEAIAVTATATGIAMPGGSGRKHHLTLPPPPPEDWNANDEDDAETLPGQAFAPFRPRRKDLEPFLNPGSEGNDLSWLLVAGLVLFCVLFACFLAGLILLIILR